MVIPYPICSMYGIFTYIYPKNQPNVGKYAIHGAPGYHRHVRFGSTYIYNILIIDPIDINGIGGSYVDEPPACFYAASWKHITMFNMVNR